ncbi:MAG: hypothetical protein R3F37_05290 [Candidatus Competibacteraceae bacterium]
MFVVRTLTLDYHRPALQRTIAGPYRLAHAGRASLLFDQQIERGCDSDQELLCAGRSKVACVATDSFRPRPVPRSILAEIFDDS